MASSERIFELLDTPVDIGRVVAGRIGRHSADERSGTTGTSTAPARADRAAHADRAIAFEHVWFAYNDDDYVLRDVSFTVEPGQRIGIVGATGAGKTTIINLLLRFYDVSRGRITVDGVDIRELPLDELRALFGLVLQDVHLFSGTIAANVRLGTIAISDDEVRRSLHAVHADAFVERARRHRGAGRRARRDACRWGRSSCCRSRARWRSIRRCSSWTKRPRASTRKPSC